nr:group II intron reverse transcriptase/maturase [Longicatena caecimuris]
MSELLEKILNRENMNKAYKRVKANKGTSGIDEVTIEDAYVYIKENWESIRAEITERKYKPQPVKRVEIPKANGGTRNLGIPTVMDRIIQQAMVQVLSPICETFFSDYSYGFRPNRSCEQAINKLLEYINDGYEWIVDIDLEKFFDNVPQDKLMSYVHIIINDGDTESLIRKYLKAGIMINGKYEKSEKGTPQGGNLSPLLSNIILNELDKELESRGLHFTRYADDCVIAVKSRASANRVMYTITKWIEHKLGLKVNATKTHITRPNKLKYLSRASANRVMHTITKWIEHKLGLKVNATKTHITRPNKLKYLGFGFYYDTKDKKYCARPHASSIQRFKRKLKQLTIRKNTMALNERIRQLNQVIRGWINYYSICNMKTHMTRIDEHLRTRLRVIIWKQWKVPSKRQWGLQKLGIRKDRARQTSYMGDHYQWVVTKTCVVRAISKEKLAQKGLVSCLDYYIERHALKLKRTAVYGTVRTVV